MVVSKKKHSVSNAYKNTHLDKCDQNDKDTDINKSHYWNRYSSLS